MSPDHTASTLRPIEHDDFDQVIAINQSNLEGVSSLDHESLSMLVKQADHALTIDDGGQLAGFVITLPTGATYDSSRYEWFESRLSDYVYLDRIVVADTHRRQGVASRLYDVVEQDRPVALEIYETNDVSLAFHRSRGYEKIGEMVHDGKTNLMMLNSLAG